MRHEREIARKFCVGYNQNPDREMYRISTKTIYPEYYSGEANGAISIDLEAFAEFGRVIEEGMKKGWFHAAPDKKTLVYKSIQATNDQVKTLASLHGFTLQRAYMAAIRRVLADYQASGHPAVAAWSHRQLADERLEVARRWFPYRMEASPVEAAEGLRRLLAICEAVSELKSDMLVRNFSAVHAIGSKEFEQTFSRRVCAILAPDDYADHDDEHGILQTLHLLKNPASVWVKGDARIAFITGEVLICGQYATPLAFTQDWIAQIKEIKVNSLLTIENLTTFNDYACAAGEFVVFTSGYANSLVIALIRKCAAQNTVADPRHFGDLDAFGFKIMRNLVLRTGVAFRPYLMDIDIYEAHKNFAIPMTDSNRNALYQMREDPYYSSAQKALFAHLLQEGKTLEQEAVGRALAACAASTG